MFSVEVVAADQEVDLARLPGEEDRRLAGGVAAADDDDVGALAHAAPSFGVAA